MSQSSTQSRSRKRDYASSISGSSLTGKTKSTTPYSAEFEQKLIDRGVYPDGYRAREGAKPSKPANMKEMQEALVQARSSLSPSKVSEEVFEEFQDNNRRAKSESTAMADVIPMITGVKDRQFETAGDIPFNNLQRFDPELSVPKPDKYYGARPDQIDERVRNDLDQYIVPSTSKQRPAAPNFFLEGKGASGRPDVAQRQASYDGAVGARAMWQLQNYGEPEVEHDDKAYTMSATYHLGTGTLQMFATHPKCSGSRTEYCTTQIDGYYMIGTSENFRKGATAYRNARDWTRQQRDRLITNANAVAQNLSPQTQSTSQSKTTLEMSSTPGTASFSSDTSADELALDQGTATKRRRPVATD